MTYSVIFFTADVKSGRDDHTGRGERRERGTAVKNAECRMQSERPSHGNVGDLTQRRQDATGGQALKLPYQVA